MKIYFCLFLIIAHQFMQAGLFNMQNNSDHANPANSAILTQKIIGSLSNKHVLKYCIKKSDPEDFNELMKLSTDPAYPHLKQACFEHLNSLLNNKEKLATLLTTKAGDYNFSFDELLTQELAHFLIMKNPQIKHELLKKIPLKKKPIAEHRDFLDDNLQPVPTQTEIMLDPPAECPLVKQKIRLSDYKLKYKVGNEIKETKCYSYHLKKRQRFLFVLSCCQGIFVFNSQTGKLIWESRRTSFLHTLSLNVRIVPDQNALFSLDNNGLLKKIAFNGPVCAELIRQDVKQFELHTNNRYLMVQYTDNNTELISLIGDATYKIPTRHPIHFAKSQKNRGDFLITPYSNPKWKFFLTAWIPLKKCNADSIDLTEFNQSDDFMHKKATFLQLALIAHKMYQNS